MKLKIINKTNFENVYAKLYKRCRRTNETIKLEFNNNEAILDINLDKWLYLFLNNGNDISTEIIILSENLDTISLE